MYFFFSIFLLYFSKILATNIDSITSYSKIREEIKSMYVCMYVCMYGISTEYHEESTAYKDISTEYNGISTQYNKNKYHKTVLAFHRL